MVRGKGGRLGKVARRGERPTRVREGTFDRSFTGVARWLLARGVRPNHLTFLQIPVFAAEAWAALAGQRVLFVALIVLVMLLDGGDGILARVGGLQSRAGAVLDATFDTVGIAIVLWGASRFFPEAAWWLALLFVGNSLLYLQNAVLGRKVVSYLRGPVLVAVLVPEALWAGLLIPAFIVVWEIAARLPQTWRRLRPVAASG